MSITLKDLAKMANVSTTTVSLVLNNRPNRISASKKNEILSLAKRFNYQANQAAITLATKESRIFGLILPDLENLFFSALAQQLEQNLRSYGFALFIVCSNEQPADDIWLINHLVAFGVAGLFICPSNEALETDVLAERLKELTIPAIMIDRVYEDIAINKVYFDNYLGAYEATKCLLEAGHRRIGCLAPPVTRYNGNSRLQGYYQALKDYNITPNLAYVLPGDYRLMSGYLNGKQLLQTQDLTAIFSCNDMMTIGLLRYLNEVKLKVPDELSLVSYDHILEFYAADQEITAVEQDVNVLSDTAVELMLVNIEQLQPPQSVCLKPALIEKFSVKKIR